MGRQLANRQPSSEAWGLFHASLFACWCHVAVTLDGSSGVLYLEGSPVATNWDLTIRPWQTLATNVYIGKSQFPADPTFGGCMSSFRIFSRALSAAEITNLAGAHPALAHRYSFSLSAPAAGWDSIGMAHGLLMGSASVTSSGLQLSGATSDYVNLCAPGAVAAEYYRL